MANYEETIDSVTGWLGKGGLIIPDEINQIQTSPLDWFIKLDAIQFSLNSVPPIKNILNTSTSLDLDDIIRSSVEEFLPTSYRINKCFNSQKYQDNNLANIAFQKGRKIQVSRKDELFLGDAMLVRDLLLPLPKLQQLTATYNGAIANIDSRINEIQSGNESWLRSIADTATLELDTLEGKAREEARKIIRTIGKALNRVTGLFKTGNVSLESSLVVPSDLGIIDVIGVVSTIASTIVKTFLLRPIALPPAAQDAIVHTTVSVVLKNLLSDGAEVLGYLAANELRKIANVLPAIFNYTGMFSGAWGFLMAVAPFIICGAVIITAAIRRSRKTNVGEWLNILAFEDINNRPDEAVAKVRGTRMERLKDFTSLRDKLLKETGKNYEKVYGFSFDDFNGKKELCLDLTAPTPVPLSNEDATSLWDQFASRYPDLIDNSLPPF
ncbi:MAG: hypothetical protein ACLFQP_00600 [Halothece sp.]